MNISRFIGIFIALFIVAVVVLVGLIVFNFDFARKHAATFQNHDNFWAAAQWVQALIYFFGVIAAALGALTIGLLRKQIEIQQDQDRRAAYRLLISPEMMAAKRILADVEVQRLLRNLTEFKGDDPVSELNKFREAINGRGAEVLVPPTPSARPALEYVETLLNEYNYLSKLLLDDQLEKGFITAAGGNNFWLSHERLKPFIALRQMINPDYALEYQKVSAKFKPTGNTYTILSKNL